MLNSYEISPLKCTFTGTPRTVRLTIYLQLPLNKPCQYYVRLNNKEEYYEAA